MQVKDENEEVDDQCGTKHWMAPEVENKPSVYNPIKADRWSCGRVLLLLDELLKEKRLLGVIGRRLKARGHKKRPSLLEWESWSDVASVREAGKGKASRPVDETTEADGEDMEPPKANKPRFSGQGEKREAMSSVAFVFVAELLMSLGE